MASTTDRPGRGPNQLDLVPAPWPRSGLYRILTLIVAAAVLFAACGDDDTGSSPTSGSETTTTAGSGSGSAVTGGTTTAPPGSGAATAGTSTSVATATGPFEQVPLRLTPIVSVNQPTAMATRVGSDDLWVAERPGRIRHIERSIDAGRQVEQIRLVTKPVLDIASLLTTVGEGGLLGLVFSPDGTKLYVDYTDKQDRTVVAEYPVTGSGDIAAIDPAQQRVLLTVDQPFTNHKGGDLHIGPDGMLYIALGDGGSGGDPNGNGQNLGALLGKILRIDPRPGPTLPYTIPADNPYADGANGARPEIWLWGVRNPWRFSFDPATNDLWVGDVGQDKVEEIDHLPASQGGGRGANLGWNLMEGDQRFKGDAPPGHVGPVATYTHDGGRCSITGGFVYRGPAIAGLTGTYLYGDYCSGEIRGLGRSADGTVRTAKLALNRQSQNPISFGQDSQGELYLMEQGGAVSRIAPAQGGLAIETVAG